MSGKLKKSSSRTSGSWSSLLAPWQGIVGVSVLGVAAIAGAMVGLDYLWRSWNPLGRMADSYHVSVAGIEVTSPPPWIKADVRDEVFRNGSLERLSLLDQDLAVRVFQAFELHPWVAKVKRVSKHPPDRIMVDLQYRQPIAWVEVPDGLFPGTPGGVLPIDGDCVLLPPEDFSSDQVDDYLRLSVQDLSAPVGGAGSVWSDARLAGAASVALTLHGVWRELGLYRVQAGVEYSQQAPQPIDVFEVRTKQGRRILWGSAPGKEHQDELPAANKIELLTAIHGKAGSLDTSSSPINLRTPDVEQLRTAHRSENSVE